MTLASYRLVWATRGEDRQLGLVVAAAAATLGFGLAFATRDPNPQLAYRGAAIVTAALIAVDFPSAGHTRWREFELGLPLAPRERARASLLLSLAIWMLPLLLALSLGQVGAFGVGVRLPLVALPALFCSASSCVLLAVALQHTLGLRASGVAVPALRGLAVAIVVLGFFLPSFQVGVAALLAALPLLASAHRAAARTPELPVGRMKAEAQGGSAPQHATFQGLALRYAVATPRAIALLLVTLLWALGATSGWVSNAAMQVLFLPMWVAYHAGWSARLLRLGHLPVSRARSFRFVVLPSLVALVIGLGLSLALAAPDRLCRIRSVDGTLTLEVPRGAWQLTAGEPAVVTAPNGESHRPLARECGLGAAVVAYDPYEVPPGASRAFLLHQLGRLLADRRGLALTAEQIDQRYVSSPGPRWELNDKYYPELSDQRALGTQLAASAGVLLLALAALHVIIRPGRALDARTWRRTPYAWILAALFLVSPARDLAPRVWKGSADPLSIVFDRVGRTLADNVVLVLALAGIAALVLYRSLQRRFEQMEAPPRSKLADTWFVEI